MQEKYTPASYQEIISMWDKELPNRFKTKMGKSIYPELLEKLKKQLLVV